MSEKNAYAVRNIIQSDWFRDIFKTRLAKNRTKVADFVTQDGGGVRSLSVHGGVTGLGADFIIVDDPVQIKDCDNTQHLERVNELFDNEIATRLNSPKNGAIVVLAHRIAENDLPGHVSLRLDGNISSCPLVATHSRTYKLTDGKTWYRKKGEMLRPRRLRCATSRTAARLKKRPGFGA